MRIRISIGGQVIEELEIDREVVVGRSSAADVCIRDDDISARHLAVRPVADGLEVEDLASTNGTVLDGVAPLEPNRPVPFLRGQKLTLGVALIEVVGVAADGGASSSSGATKFGATLKAGAGKGHSGLIAIARFRAAAPRLIVAVEHDRRSVDLTEMEVVIGRDRKDCQVAIQHQSVSAQHAAIRFTKAGFEVRDLGSANGTFLGDARVEGWTPLTPPAALRFGTAPCLFAATPPEAGNDDERLATALVEHVVAQGRATRHEGAAVLAEHRESGCGVGELLVVRGLLTPAAWVEIHSERAVICAVSRGGAAVESRGVSVPMRLLVVALLVAGVVAAYLALR